MANGAGCPTRALITDMNEPLATAAGNALEMANAARFLRGDAIDGRLYDVTVALGAELLAPAGLAADPGDGARPDAQGLRLRRRRRALRPHGRGARRPDGLPRRLRAHLAGAPEIAEVPADATGFVAAIDTRALGLAVVELGGGRRRASDPIDHAVGLEGLIGLGASVEPDTPLARIHAADPGGLAAAEARIRAAYRIADTRPRRARRSILERIA